MTGDLTAALVAAALCGAGGALMPALLRRVPEPAPDPDPRQDEDPKEPYAEIAGRPSLRVGVPLSAALAGGAIGATLGWAWPLLFLVPLVPVCAALTVVDWRTRLIPAKVVWPTYLVVLAGVLVSCAATRDPDALVRAGAGLLAASALYHLMWFVYPKGMGYGDVRFSGVLGLVLGQLGWPELVVGVYAGFLLGGVVGGLLSLLRLVDRRAYPFGPFMVLGALVGVVGGEPVLGVFVGR